MGAPERGWPTKGRALPVASHDKAQRPKIECMKHISTNENLIQRCRRACSPTLQSWRYPSRSSLSSPTTLARSRKPTQRARLYPTHELELLAVVPALKELRPYLPTSPAGNT